MKCNTYCVGMIVLSIVAIDISLCESSTEITMPEQQRNEYHSRAACDIFDACLGEPTEACGDMSSHLSSGPSWSTQWYEDISFAAQQWTVSLLCRYCVARQWLIQKLWKNNQSEC